MTVQTDMNDAWFIFVSEQSVDVLVKLPCVVLWVPEALDCRVPISPRGLEYPQPAQSKSEAKFPPELTIKPNEYYNF